MKTGAFDLQFVKIKCVSCRQSALVLRIVNKVVILTIHFLISGQ